MSKRDDITAEKERLMEEVLGNKRTSSFDSVDARSYLSNKEKTLKESNEAMSELNEILAKQQKELEAMTAQMAKDNGVKEVDYDALQKEIENDYGVKLEPEPLQKINNSKEIFVQILEELKTKVLGQKEALKDLIIAFRRPFVMGEEKGKAKNAIIISGPEGSGRHSCVMEMSKALYHRQIFLSDEVYTLDMSLYTSSSQESLFLQDLYTALQGQGGIICFENCESGYSPFLRMISNLVCDGKVMLNKRYINNKGQLIEAQSGLVTEAISSLSAEGKYLVFITDKKVSKIIDVFGASFLDHVLDRIELKQIDNKSLKAIIENQISELIAKCKTNLKIELVVDKTINDYIFDHYESENGVESITSQLDEYYIVLSQIMLEKNVADEAKATLIVEEQKPIAKVGRYTKDLIKPDNSNKELDEINAELNEVVGLNQVKDYVRSLQSHIKVQQMRRLQGMKTTEVSKHMIFTGNPGTGKTTIARLISRYMKAIGALSQGQLVEVTRADLVGQYVGHTAPLTMQVIKSAIGGVLFIDEAYSLYRGKDDSFGLEAIDTLVKAMEDNRDDLIVILAGYSKEMETFLEANSGLKSRFPNVIHFPDYTGEELMLIAKSIAKGKEYRIDEAALEPLKEYFTKVQSINAREGGNGRLARNIVEEAILKQSKRLLDNPKDEMDLLKLEDFDLEIKIEPEK